MRKHKQTCNTNGTRERGFLVGLNNVKEGKLLYHLTKLSNMESVITEGLLPRRYLSNHKRQFDDVADPQIINKRKELDLDGYIPFHFHPYSAFDVAVKNTFSDDKFVYICIRRALAEFNNFKILVRHPLSQDDCVLYDYDEGIDKIDWETMKTAGTTDEYSRNVKMAECIAKKCIPPELFQCVYVPDLETKKYIEKLFLDQEIYEQPPYVDIRPQWF